MRAMILAAILAAASAASARAEPAAPVLAPERRQLATIGVGLAEPVGKVDFRGVGGGPGDNGDLGVHLSGQYVYYLTPRIGAGFSVDYFERAGTQSESLYPAADARVAGDSWVMLGILRCSLTDGGKARPFVLVGAGGGWNKTTVDVRPSNWPDTNTHETRRLIDDSAWVPAATARIGLDIDAGDVAPGIVILEAGWTGMAGAGYGPTARGRALGISGVSGPLNILSFTARYGWRF